MRVILFGNLVRKNMMRNKRRSIITICGLTVALLVISVLLSVNQAFTRIIKSGSTLNFTVYEKNRACPISSRIPDKYKEAIKEMLGIGKITGVLSTSLHYKDLETFVYLSGIMPDAGETFFSLKNIRVIAGENSFVAGNKARDEALVGKAVAKRFGWGPGDRITLVENNFTFTVKGVFKSSDLLLEGHVLVNKRYLADTISAEGKATYLLGNIEDGDSLNSVASKIDDFYANFPTATKTQSESATNARLMEDFQGLRKFMLAMIVATIIAMLAGTANTVSMSVQERVREIAVLRTLGYKRPQILSIIVSESIIISLLGGTIGVVLAAVFLAAGPSLLGFLTLRVTDEIIVTGLVLSISVGLLGGMSPALVASRLNIVKALRSID